MAPSSPPRRPRPAPSTRTAASYARPAASPPSAPRALPATPGRGSYAAALAKATGRVNGHNHPTRPTAAEASASAVAVAAPPRAAHGDAAAAALRRLAASLAAAQPRTVVVAESVPAEAPPRTPEVMYDVVAAEMPRRARVPALDLTPGPRRSSLGDNTPAASTRHRVSNDDGEPLFPGAHTAARAAARRSSSASGAPTPRLVLTKPLPPVTAWRPPSGTPTRKETVPAPVENKRRPPPPRQTLPRAAPALLAAARAAIDDAVIDVATPVTPAWAGVRAPDGRLATAADVPFDVPERPKRRWWFGKKK